MKEKKRAYKWISLILSLALVMTMGPLGGTKVMAAQAWDCGKVAGTVTATLDDAGNMVISGEGYMTSFTAPTDQPWYGSKDLIKSLVVKGGVVGLSDYAFTSCKNLTSVTLESGVRNLGKYVFSGCTNLTSIELSNTLGQILENAFSYTAITSIHLPNTLTWINWNIFESCTKLKTIEIPKFDYVGSLNFNADTSYEQGTFTKSSIENFVIPSDVTVIYPYQYYGYAGFTSYTIPDNIKSIGQYSFYKTKLTSMDIPENVKSIGQYAFEKCTSLANVYIYSNDVSISANAFAKTTIIHGFASSTAKGYANANGLIFEPIEDIAPSVSTQSKTFDKYTPSDVTFTVNLGVGTLKDTTVKDIQIDDVSIDSSKWSRNSSTVKIDKSVFSSMDKGTSHFITVIFDDFSDTSTKNVKVSITDTTPDKSPLIQQGNIVFNKDTDPSVNFAVDLGLGALSATTVDDVRLNDVSLLPSDWSFSNGKIIINSSAFTNALVGVVAQVSVKFNDTSSTVATGLSVTVDGIKSLPNVLIQSSKYSGNNLQYSIAYNEYHKSIKAVTVNGQDLPAVYWNVADTTLTIDTDYLSILSNGLYNVALVYDSDSVLAGKLSFTVPKDTSGVTTQNSLLNVIYVSGSTTDLDLSLPGAPSSVSGFYINSTEVGSSNWSFNPDTKVLTISHEYLNSLGVGTRSMILTLNYEGTLHSRAINIYAGLGAGSTTVTPGDVGIIISAITTGTTGLTYHVDEHGNTIIDGYTGNDKNVTIPSDVNGSPVTGIDNLGNKPVETVKVPDSVTNINNGAIDSGTTIVGNPGSAAENYANNNGNNFNNGGNNLNVNVPIQTITYNTSTGTVSPITGVVVNNGATLDSITVEGCTVVSGGAITDQTGGRVGNVNSPFTYDADTGTIQINPEVLKTVGVSRSQDIGLNFSDGTIVKTVTLNLTDGSGSGTGNNGGNGSGTDNGNGSGTGNNGGSGNGGTGSGSNGSNSGAGSSDSGTGTGSNDNGSGAGSGSGSESGNGTGAGSGSGNEGSQSDIKRNITLSVGSKAKIRPVKASKYTEYKSSNTKILSVNSNGVIQALAVGSVIFTATDKNGKDTSITVNVVKNSKIAGNYIYNKYNGYIGNKTTIFTGGVTKKFKKYDKDLTINNKGLVTFVKSGKSVVTVTEYYNGMVISHNISFTIAKPYISTKSTVKSVKIGKKAQLKIKVVGQVNSKIKWRSSNTKIAKINSKGVVSGVKKGTTYIIVSSGKLTTKFKVTVK